MRFIIVALALMAMFSTASECEECKSFHEAGNACMTHKIMDGTCAQGDDECPTHACWEEIARYQNCVYNDSSCNSECKKCEAKQGALYACVEPLIDPETGKCHGKDTVNFDENSTSAMKHCLVSMCSTVYAEAIECEKTYCLESESDVRRLQSTQPRLTIQNSEEERLIMDGMQDLEPIENRLLGKPRAFTPNGACNCSRQLNGSCAATVQVCTPGSRCVCTSKAYICVGLCTPVRLGNSRPEIQYAEEESMIHMNDVQNLEPVKTENGLQLGKPRGITANGACNCSRQSNGLCAATVQVCTPGSRCVCTSKMFVCVGLCTPFRLGSTGPAAIQNAEEENMMPMSNYQDLEPVMTENELRLGKPRAFTANGACNCSRQSNGSCAATVQVCTPGSRCVCTSKMFVCVGLCTPFRLGSTGPASIQNAEEENMMPMSNYQDLESVATEQNGLRLGNPRACNCRRRLNGSCAATVRLCTPRSRCVCTAKAFGCVGLCTSFRLGSTGPAAIQNAEEENMMSMSNYQDLEHVMTENELQLGKPRGITANDACNCSRQSNGSCAATVQVCTPGSRCVCTSKMFVCVGLCTPFRLGSTGPASIQNAEEESMMPMNNVQNLESVVTQQNGLQLGKPRAFTANGACNCSRQSNGSCAATVQVCTPGSRCVCTSKMFVCVGLCTPVRLGSTGPASIQYAPEESMMPMDNVQNLESVVTQQNELQLGKPRAITANGACNCSRQSNGSCAATVQVCTPGSRCVCTSKMFVCVGLCTPVRLQNTGSVIPIVGVQESNILSTPMKKDEDMESINEEMTFVRQVEDDSKEQPFYKNMWLILNVTILTFGLFICGFYCIKQKRSREIKLADGHLHMDDFPYEDQSHFEAK